MEEAKKIEILTEFSFELITKLLEREPDFSDSIAKLRESKEYAEDAKNISEGLRLLNSGNSHEVKEYIDRMRLHYAPYAEYFLKSAAIYYTQRQMPDLIIAALIAQTVDDTKILKGILIIIPFLAAFREGHKEVLSTVWGNLSEGQRESLRGKLFGSSQCGSPPLRDLASSQLASPQP